MNGFLKSALIGVALAAVAGCGGGDDKSKAGGNAAPKPAASGGDAKAPAPAPGAGGAYDAAKSTASVKGVVKWTGAKPTVSLIQPASDPFCQSKHQNGMPNPRFVVADGGGLPDAFVWAFKGPHEGMTGFPAPSSAVTLDQHECMYVPHVLGLRVGQTFTVKNSDNTTHNVHIRPKANEEKNQAQAFGDSKDFVFKSKERAMAINCDIHTWMSSFAFVLDHPFFAVTDANGNFEIKGLPPGTYKFKIWHESFTADKTSIDGEFDLTVKDGEAASHDVELK